MFDSFSVFMIPCFCAVHATGKPGAYRPPGARGQPASFKLHDEHEPPGATPVKLKTAKQIKAEANSAVPGSEPAPAKPKQKPVAAAAAAAPAKPKQKPVAAAAAAPASASASAKV